MGAGQEPTEEKPCSREAFYGRYWARNGREVERLGLTWGDLEPLLQGFLVDAEGRPVSLSPTAIHSALGQIRDKLLRSDAARELAVALLRELIEP